MKLTCLICSKDASGEVDEDTWVRGAVICPECICRLQIGVHGEPERHTMAMFAMCALIMNTSCPPEENEQYANAVSKSAYRFADLMMEAAKKDVEKTDEENTTEDTEDTGK